LSATDTTLGLVHAKLAEKLLLWLSDKECTAAQAACCIKFLKDNNIEATRDSATLKKMASLVDSLPFSSADDLGLAN
jgi:hypothetical protein